jgi:hypothetical protein
VSFFYSETGSGFSILEDGLSLDGVPKFNSSTSLYSMGLFGSLGSLSSSFMTISIFSALIVGDVI